MDDSIGHADNSPSQEASAAHPEIGDKQKLQVDGEAAISQNKRRRFERKDSSTPSPLVSTKLLDPLTDGHGTSGGTVDEQERAAEPQISEGIVEDKELSNDTTASEMAPLPSTSGPVATTTTVESADGDISTKQPSKSRKALELMRAKLELAKKKKLAAQDQLRRKQQLSDEAKLKDAASSSVSVSQRSNARTSFLRRSESRSPHPITDIPPITALKEDLVVVNISQTGPADMVRFTSDDEDDSGNSTGHEEDDAAAESETLAARKSKLEQDLDVLRQRLEKKQKAVQKRQPIDSGATRSDDEGAGAALEDEVKKEKYAAMSKEELEKRKIEVQEMRDVSYWKHYVSKQQHLLSGVTEQVKENADALQECDNELANVNRSIEKTSQIVADLDARQKFVSEKLSENVTKLMEARRRLHELRQTEAESKPPAASLNDAEDEDIPDLDGLSDVPEKSGVEETMNGSGSDSDSESDADQFEDAVMDLPKEPGLKGKRNEKVEDHHAQQESKSQQLEAASDADDDQFADPQESKSHQHEAASDADGGQYADPQSESQQNDATSNDGNCDQFEDPC